MLLLDVLDLMVTAAMVPRVSQTEHNTTVLLF